LPFALGGCFGQGSENFVHQGGAHKRGFLSVRRGVCGADRAAIALAQSRMTNRQVASTPKASAPKDSTTRGSKTSKGSRLARACRGAIFFRTCLPRGDFGFFAFPFWTRARTQVRLRRRHALPKSVAVERVLLRLRQSPNLASTFAPSQRSMQGGSAT